MRVRRRDREKDRFSGVGRSLGAVLAVAALLGLSAVQGLGFHEVAHRGDWISAAPDAPQVVPSATGASSEPGCPLCLASGQLRAGGLASASGASPGPASAGSLPLGPRSELLPAAVDAFVADPRAPPYA